MITLPSGLEKFMQGKDLTGLKPFALLYRNKWDSANNVYALDTANPIDISAMILKPNTLSMTLDVNEVAQYNANNVTLTLSDTKNYFVEDTPNSYFPEGYQLYGSRIVLYYGTDGVNRTPLFTGVIKELPTHKPENYQVDVKLVSPLEMLKDIEAKDFSDKVTGETLTYKSTESDGHRIYWTTGTGVGGFDAVYANGTKLFEGVDYETDQLNALGLPAVVTIINSNYYSSTITADYYTWKTGLTVEQIVAGLVGLAGYDTGTEDIRNVAWNTSVRTQYIPNLEMSIGYKSSGLSYLYFGGDNYYWNGGYMAYGSSSYRYNYFPTNFRINFTLLTWYYGSSYYYRLGIFDSSGNLSFGFTLGLLWANNRQNLWVDQTQNGSTWRVGTVPTIRSGQTPITIEKNGNSISFSTPYGTINAIIDFDLNNGYYNEHVFSDTGSFPVLGNYVLTNTDTSSSLSYNGIILNGSNSVPSVWSSVSATLSNSSSQYSLDYRTSIDGISYTTWQAGSIGVELAVQANYFQTRLQITSLNQTTNIESVYFYVLTSTLVLNLVVLSGLTVLEALQDFALISGYEFGVDRQGVFFFRPRVASTTPTYILDHNEIVKVDTVKKNLSDFFTKLTLTFAQVPLEFYANTGEIPTPIDKYGVINKEIDKPDIVNYDNPELAQAIGPQLLEVYSALPNVIQATGKLNLALELGDIVQLDRNYNLIEPESAGNYTKYQNQQTYYRACKITGMNYNFAKRQITYTLRDVSNSNNSPIENADLYEFVYELPVRLGVK